MGTCSRINYRSFRILLTEACNANCPNCFNSHSRSTVSMPVSTLDKLCQYLSDNGITRLKIMGGEPTCHPDFKECMECIKNHFKETVLFTNCYKINSLQDIQFREGDTIIVNFRFYTPEITRQLFKIQNSRIGFEVQISSNSNPNFIREQMMEAEDIFGSRPLAFKFTLDCTENIFEKKQSILNNWRIITKGLGEKTYYGIDHAIPYCFTKNEGLTIPDNCHFCKEGCYGLIDSHFVLHHCNQYDIPLISILQDGNFIPFYIVENYLAMARHQKLAIALNKICSLCPFYGKKCNGGCFIHKSQITRESMIK